MLLLGAIVLSAPVKLYHFWKNELSAPLHTWQTMWSFVYSMSYFVLIWYAFHVFAFLVGFEFLFGSIGSRSDFTVGFTIVRGRICSGVFYRRAVWMLRRMEQHLSSPWMGLFLNTVQGVHGQTTLSSVPPPCHLSHSWLRLRKCKMDPSSTVIVLSMSQSPVC